jgi:hypothetical protein
MYVRLPDCLLPLLPSRVSELRVHHSKRKKEGKNHILAILCVYDKPRPSEARYHIHVYMYKRLSVYRYKEASYKSVR